MTRYILAEGEALLLVAVFDHLKPYYEQAKAKGTSVADEMKSHWWTSWLWRERCKNACYCLPRE